MQEANPIYSCIANNSPRFPNEQFFASIILDEFPSSWRILDVSVEPKIGRASSYWRRH